MIFNHVHIHGHPVQLMTPGIGRNASCTLGDFFFTSRPVCDNMAVRSQGRIMYIHVHVHVALMFVYVHVHVHVALMFVYVALMFVSQQIQLFVHQMVLVCVHMCNK